MSRNGPCGCGSGRKRKLCCPLPSQHPLRARAAWLWTKVRRYLQTPPQAYAVLEIGGRVWGAAPDERAGESAGADALTDPLVLDVAAFEGGLLGRFAARRGPLLPDDEASLLQRWAQSRRSAYEVAATRAGFGVRLLDLITGEVVEVAERLSVVGLARGDVVLTRLLDGGQGPVLGSRLPLPPQGRDALLAALDQGSEASLLAWRRGVEVVPAGAWNQG